MKLPKPLNDWLLIQRDRSNTTSGGITIPDKHVGFVDSSCKLLAIGTLTSGLNRGQPCSPLLEVGDVLLHEKMTEGSEYWTHPEDPSIQLIKRSEVFGFAREGMVRAYGNKVLVRRQMQMHEMLPEDRQSLYGTIVSIGVSDEPFKTHGLVNLGIGDQIKIQKWSENIHELNLKGTYHLVVPEELIECVYKGDFPHVDEAYLLIY